MIVLCFCADEDGDEAMLGADDDDAVLGGGADSALRQTSDVSEVRCRSFLSL